MDSQANPAHEHLEALMEGVRTICNAAEQLASLHGVPKDETLASSGSEASLRVPAKSFAILETTELPAKSCSGNVSTAVLARSLQSLSEEVMSLRKQLMTNQEFCRGRLGSSRSTAPRPSPAGSAKALELQQLMLRSEVFAEREELADSVKAPPHGGSPLPACAANGAATTFQQARPLILTSSLETLPPPLPTSSRKSAATSAESPPQKSKAFVEGFPYESSHESPFSFALPVAGSGDTLTSPPAPTYKADSALLDVPLNQTPLTLTSHSSNAVLMQPWSAVDPTSLAAALQQWEAAQEETIVTSKSSRRLTNVTGKRFASASSTAGGRTSSGTLLPSKTAQQLLPGSDNKKTAAPQRRRCCAGSCMAWVLHPMSFTRVLWDGLCLIVLGMDLLGFPLLAFDLETRAPRPILDALAIFHASFWTLDMIMSLRTGFSEGPLLVLDAKAAAMHYLKTWFLFDLVLVARDWGERVLHKYTRALVLLRTVKLPVHIGRFEEVVNSPPVTIMLSVVKLGAVLGVAVHGITCAWWWIGQYHPSGWAHKEQVVKENFFHQYSYAARWALAQISGRVDQVRDRTTFELAFTSLVGSFTVIIMSIFIALITTRMMELQTLVDIATKNSRTLRHYLEQHSKSISWTFTFYAKKYVKGQEGLLNHADNEDQVLKMLPPKLQRDLLHEVRSPILMRHSLLRDIDLIHPPSLKLLCSKACSLVHAASTEVLFERGDACGRMLFIDEGELRYFQVGLRKKMALRGDENSKNLNPAALGEKPGGSSPGTFSRLFEFVGLQDLSPDGDHCASPSQWRGGGAATESVVTDGDVVCEPSLWFEWRNVGDMVAAKNCQLIALEAAPFADVVKSFSDAFRLVSLYALCYHSMFHSSLEATERERNDLTRLDVGCLADFDLGTADIRTGTTAKALMSTSPGQSPGRLPMAPHSGSHGEEQWDRGAAEFAKTVGSDTIATGP